ncbi:hypothetical protein F0562_033744 [Nyssa sinensis]|uniref:CBS domain-containing protein n=1 Tax=Nyssa sinensis TaxID=561372 RepID=A0A5J5AIZ6_9ASTE|nr:hypothetical protein F0562_033744 [Nyssa sinensis]
MLFLFSALGEFMPMASALLICFQVLPGHDRSALSASSTEAAGVGAGAVGTLGVLALGATGPIAIAVSVARAAGIAGVAANRGMGKNAPTAAQLDDDFYKVILQEEPFKSTTLTVMDFHEHHCLNSNDNGKVIIPITCELDSTVGSMIQSLASKSAHRIHVVAAKDNAVVGVITVRCNSIIHL